MAADFGIVLSMQPGFYYLWDRERGGDFEPFFGRERTNRMDPYPEIIKRGGIICGGSDSPVTRIEPLVDIATCVNGFNPVRNISVTDALKMFTINGAYAVHLEKTKGSLEAGKDGDVVVIDKNPYDYQNSALIYEMEVEMTIKNGKIVYEK